MFIVTLSINTEDRDQATHLFETLTEDAVPYVEDGHNVTVSTNFFTEDTAEEIEPSREDLIKSFYELGQRLGILNPEEVRILHIMGSDPTEEIHTDDTMRKVSEALYGCGLSTEALNDVINALQNNGILFRERKQDYGTEIVAGS